MLSDTIVLSTAIDRAYTILEITIDNGANVELMQLNRERENILWIGAERDNDCETFVELNS